MGWKGQIARGVGKLLGTSAVQTALAFHAARVLNLRRTVLVNVAALGASDSAVVLGHFMQERKKCSGAIFAG